MSLHELLSLSQAPVQKGPDNAINQYTFQAMNQLTSGIRQLSGEQVSEQPLELRLSPADQAKLGQSKATRATTAELSSQQSKRSPESPDQMDLAARESATRQMMNVFPGMFGKDLDGTVLGSDTQKAENEHDLVVFNDRMTLDRLEVEIKPPELAMMEKEESYDVFSVSPSLINFSNELDINEANELVITRRIYMN